MLSLKVCTAVCLLSYCRLRAALGAMTEDHLMGFQKSEQGMMALTLQGGTCYTDINRICVLDVSDRPDGSEFSIGPIHPNYDDEYGDNVIQPGAITAHRSVDYKVDVVGKSLETVVENCKQAGKANEGFVRIVNVIESVVFTVVSRFCTLSTALLDGHNDKLMIDARNCFLDFVDFYVLKKFAKFGIAFEPISRVAAAVSIVTTDDVARCRRVIFYRGVCQEFSQRFSPMFDLVKVGTYDTSIDPADPLSAYQELMSNMRESFQLFRSYQKFW